MSWWNKVTETTYIVKTRLCLLIRSSHNVAKGANGRREQLVLGGVGPVTHELLDHAVRAIKRTHRADMILATVGDVADCPRGIGLRGDVVKREQAIQGL